MLPTSRERLAGILSRAGVRINGDKPWDIAVRDGRFFDRVLAKGSVGLGEAYMDGWWDCPRLEEFFFKVLRSGLEEKIYNWRTHLAFLKAKLFNLQTRVRSRAVARHHYDLSPDFYMSFLDPYNQYTCGYFKGTDDLNRAQEAKLELLCRKLRLESRDRVLDIGCGWGGFAKYAAQRYGCHVTGVTLSDEQLRFARKFCKGLPVSILKSDYRDLRGEFDKVLVCGMIEHVGHRNYRTLMEVVHRCLQEEGLFLLHTIGSGRSFSTGDGWMTKYIFPNSMTPSIRQLGEAIEGLFVMEDWQNFGAYYFQTLMGWLRNFDANWGRFQAVYGERFYRMWRYYLLMCAGSFRARNAQLWQVVMSKKGVLGGYEPVTGDALAQLPRPPIPISA